MAPGYVLHVCLLTRQFPVLWHPVVVVVAVGGGGNDATCWYMTLLLYCR
jgi:hypothetical protein